VADIQGKLVKWGGRGAISRHLRAKDDKKTIATWRLDLDKILQVFNVRSVLAVKTSANFPTPERTRNKHKCNRFQH